jgi:shikimate kinase
MAIRFCHATQSVPCFAGRIKRGPVPAIDFVPDGRFNQPAGGGSGMTRDSDETRVARQERLALLAHGRPIVLVGMMGAGKTTIGRRLAAKLGRSFIDSDEEVERAAGMSIEDIFASHGEADFRAGEARVISRLLREGDIVLGTGGGAFINPETRALIREEGISVWIRADFELLFARVSRRSNRPLLKTANPRETLKALIEARYPIYAEADVTVLSRDVPQDQVANDVVDALIAHLEPAEEPAQEAGHG